MDSGPGREAKVAVKRNLSTTGRASAFASKLRNAMAKIVRSKPGSGVDDTMVVVVDTPSQAVRDTIRDIVEHVPGIIEARQSKLTDEAIDALVSVYMRTPNVEVERLLYDSNAKARARFLQEWPGFTSKDLADAAGHGSKNRSMTASRWKSKGKVFSIKHGGVEYFPAFQFEDGQPIETIGKALASLGEKKSGWQLAFWFTSPNGWLDGKRPVDVIKDSNAVVQAAAREAEDIIG
ncbi:hypothetical protein IE4872_PD00103 (plasmid) [Rhizobium gallicum]|uniref:Antitoxin Xre/MbcA/ParS-like toxin-binding domain-containing protein n=1 Tax=Rhizobium gallicum TaxID=56730 RepID=A0A1L5NRW8_9HYPH|nr:hypothetical protein IE4872_PD00103 [Rhizobium gallicum]